MQIEILFMDYVGLSWHRGLGLLFKGSTFVSTLNVAIVSDCIRLPSQQKSDLTFIIPLMGK